MTSEAAPLTFAIPFYSGREYLERTLRSVLAQGDGHWQVLVCDDGSEPGIDRLVASLRDPRMHYHANAKNLGMAGNFNQCIDLATTDLVTVLHADDELDPAYCGAMRSAASRYPKAAAIFCQARIIDAQSQPRFSLADLVKRYVSPVRDRELVLEGQRALASLLTANFIYAPTLCFRKSVLGARRFPAEYRFVLDWELTVRIILDGDHLVGLPQRCYSYRRHDEAATEKLTRANQRYQEEAAFYDRMGAIAAERGWADCATAARRRTILKLNVAYRTLKSAAGLKLDDAKRGLRVLRGL